MKEVKVYKNIQGRLGNQMFQYASVKGFLRKNNISTNIKLCFKDVYSKNFDNDLKDLSLKNYEEVDSYQLTFVQKFLLGFIVIIEKIIKIFSNEENFDIRRNKFERRVARNWLKTWIIQNG